MAATPDAYAKLLFNDGEGATPDDLNDLQGLMYAQIFDNLLSHSLTDGLGDPSGSYVTVDPEDTQALGLGFDFQSHRVYVPWPTAGVVKAHLSDARKLTISPGTVMVFLDEPFNGYAEALTPIRLAGGPLTTAVGDATNPRIDLIVMTAVYVDSDAESRDFEDAVTGAKSTTTPDKRRRVEFELSIVAGTPAANPTYPATAGGNYVLAAVRVPATHNAVHSPVNLRDMRWPLGRVKIYDVLAKDFFFAGANPWTFDDGNQKAFANNTGTDDTFAILRMNGKQGRVVGVGILGESGASAEADLVRVEHSADASTGPTVRDLVDLMGLAGGPLFNNPGAFRIGGVFEIADALSDPSSPGGIRQTGTANGNPIWTNGYSAGMCMVGPTLTTLGVRLRSEDVAAVSLVRFYVLEGL